MAEARRHKSVAAGTVTVIVLLVLAAGFGVYKLFNRGGVAIDTRNLTIRPLTEHGQAVGLATISADGRLVAYGRREGERSLRVKQVATGSEVTVVPPQTGFFGTGATLTPDGNYLYYAHTDPANLNNTNIYAVPALGGATRQVVGDVATTVAFSPDGKRIVYGRKIQSSSETQLLVANADGTGEQVIFRHGATEALLADPSWSAAGNLIALSSFEAGKNSITSILVLTPEGKLVKDFPLPIFVTAVSWLPDASGLFFVGAEKSTGLRFQVWFQPYPAGDRVKISNDLNQYTSLAVTGDGKSFVATQERLAATIYLGDFPAVLKYRIDWKLTPISNEEAPGFDLSWTAAGKLLHRDAAFHIYQSGGAGSNRVRLLENDDVAFHPMACGPGEIVIVSRVLEGNVPNLWRLNVGTGELKQLTFGKDEERGSCTPDGKWMLYNGPQQNDAGHIFKISTDGGTPIELAHGTQFDPLVSPDGKLIAYGITEGQGAGAKSKLVLQSLDGGPPVQEINAAAGFSQVAWTRDGRAFTYVRNTTGNTQNIYMQPLAGGPEIQLTHFNSEPAVVAAYAWSWDGKKLAITRARYNDSDVVLFSGFR
jgi:Tol biopolymer transport system component